MAGIEIAFTLEGHRGTLTHIPSGASISTARPVENGGDGSSFSATDLLAASLVSCAISTMALNAGREGLDWFDASGRVVKTMVGPPRRVGELAVEITMPSRVRAEHRARLEALAHECPVSRSLSAGVRVTFAFVYA